MSLRIAPAASHSSQTAATHGAPSAPGVHDTLRSNLQLTEPAAAAAATETVQLASRHPLEARLARWRQTQDELKMTMLRRQFGLAEPVKRGMEARIAGAGEWRPRALGGPSRLHSDILAGRDTEIGWEDVFVGDELRPMPDFHTEMEARLKMRW